MFSEDLYCYLHICSSSYLRQSLLTDFKGEILSITLARDSETFLDFSPDSPVPCFLLPLVAEFLPQFYKAPGWVLTPLFCFPKCAMEAQVFGLSGLQILASFLCVFTNHLSTLALAIIRKDHTQRACHRMWGCAGEASRGLMAPVCQLGEPMGKTFPAAHRWAS